MRTRFSKDLEFTRKPWRYPLWQVANEPELFAYKAGNRADGVCLVERIDLPDGRIVISCIAVTGNPGNSITNCVEELCFQVCERFEIPAEKLVWLEHYDYDDDAEWNMVEFKRMPPDRPFEDPTWIRMTPEMWRDLRLRTKKNDFSAATIATGQRLRSCSIGPMRHCYNHYRVSSPAKDALSKRPVRDPVHRHRIQPCLRAFRLRSAVLVYRNHHKNECDTGIPSVTSWRIIALLL